MDSDNDSYHSESEFYYPDEENILQENRNFENTSNDIEDQEISTIQEFIEAQRPENTIKKNRHLCLEKILFIYWRGKRA